MTGRGRGDERQVIRARPREGPVVPRHSLPISRRATARSRDAWLVSPVTGRSTLSGGSRRAGPSSGPDAPLPLEVTR